MTTRNAATRTTTNSNGRRIVRVSKDTVAAARAQVNLAIELGKIIPPAVAKIAQVR